MPENRDSSSYVDLFQIRFPRLTQKEALDLLLDNLAKKKTTGICIADMSTLNLVYTLPEFRTILQKNFQMFNDGVGLATIAALRGKPFPANLNGTDLIQHFLSSVPKGTTVYLLGGLPGVSTQTRKKLSEMYPQVSFVGDHTGYFERKDEEDIIQEIAKLKPQVIYISRGNPLQMEFINKYLQDKRFQGTIWWASGGFFDYYGGTLVRAPVWMRKLGLEWLSIVLRQPYKFKRYFIGIPLFLMRSAWLGITKRHDFESKV
jgi:N-acetylglucosaminyldiphosphoundecaprenol N-acetyl-beta-D-mannosaminyltransferase